MRVGRLHASAAGQGKQQANNKLNKITDDLYEIEGDGGNVAFYITNEGVIVVDDKFEYDFNDIMAKIKSVTSQPVKYVLNTHHHGDHTGSNAQLLRHSGDHFHCQCPQEHDRRQAAGRAARGVHR